MLPSQRDGAWGRRAGGRTVRRSILGTLGMLVLVNLLSNGFLDWHFAGCARAAVYGPVAFNCQCDLSPMAAAAR